MNGVRFLDPGLLDRRAVLEENAAALDEMGGAAPEWSERVELSVHVEPIEMRAGERFGQREATLTHRVTLRHRSDVARGMAFRVGLRRLLIRSVIDPDERRRFLVCRCEEEA